MFLTGTSAHLSIWPSETSLHHFLSVPCRGMTRWREYTDLHHIDEMKEAPEEAVLTSPLPGPNPPTVDPLPTTQTSLYPGDVTFIPLPPPLGFCYNKGPPVYESATLRPPRQLRQEQEAESNLFRCMSDASLVKRRRGGRGKSQAQRERERQHRFSINGHFYNYKAGPGPATSHGLRPSPLPLSAPPPRLSSLLLLPPPLDRHPSSRHPSGPPPRFAFPAR